MAEIKKICPLPDIGFCKKEKCAWWIKQEQCCAIVVIADNLNILGAQVAEAGFS